MHTKLHNQKLLTKKRQLLRKSLPPAEITLWHHLKSSQLQNHKFRRQHSIGSFIADFYCPKERLVIEIDGDSHFSKEAQEYGAKRTKFLNSLNIKVIRFTNIEVLQNIEGVLLEIVKNFRN